MSRFYLTVDGMMSGTGIRDINGDYVDPQALGLSEPLVSEISEWRRLYELCHILGHGEHMIEELDERGLKIREMVKKELPDSKVSYFSDGRSKRLVWE